MIAKRHRRSSNVDTARSRPNASDGQALIEFTIIGLLLMLMAFGTLEIGRAYYASTAVTHAARDAARVAMDPSRTNAEIEAAAEAAADPLTLNVTINRSTTEGELSTITVSHSFEAVTPLVSNLWGGGALVISASATSRVGWD